MTKRHQLKKGFPGNTNTRLSLDNLVHFFKKDEVLIVPPIDFNLATIASAFYCWSIFKNDENNIKILCPKTWGKKIDLEWPEEPFLWITDKSLPEIDNFEVIIMWGINIIPKQHMTYRNKDSKSRESVFHYYLPKSLERYEKQNYLPTNQMSDHELYQYESDEIIKKKEIKTIQVFDQYGPKPYSRCSATFSLPYSGGLPELSFFLGDRVGKTGDRKYLIKGFESLIDQRPKIKEDMILRPFLINLGLINLFD